jgi:NADH:ubiquinone oxidoreductase subunit 3 (subunit A)
MATACLLKDTKDITLRPIFNFVLKEQIIVLRNLEHQFKTKKYECGSDYINLEVEEVLHVILNDCPGIDCAIDYYLYAILVCECKLQIF